MTSMKLIWKLAAVAAILPVTVAACSAGVSKEDYDAAQAKATAEQQKSAALQQQLTAAQAKAADLEKQAAAKSSTTALLFAQAVPTPTPRPPPTPPPAGFTPPPAAKPDAAVLNEVLPYAFYVETLATSSVSKYGMASFVGVDNASACNPNSIFQRGTKFVMRFEVIDTKTGKRLTGEEGAVVKVVLPHGEELASRYSKRGGVGPWMWSIGWDIPPDYQLGAFDFGIKVSTPDGRSYTWKQPALVRPATATAKGTDSRVQIIA